MIGSEKQVHGRAKQVRRHIGGSLVAVAALLVIGATSVAAYAYGGGGTTGKFTATVEARAITDGTVTSCRGLGPEGQKIEARYQGTFTVDGEEFGIHFVLEALVDRSAGAGTAEGRWTLLDPSGRDIVGRGELLATVTSDPPGEATPTNPALELQGMLIGYAQPPDPEMPDQRLLGNFSGSLSDGALNFTLGNPTVGDPTAGELLPAVLIASDPC